ncbi:MAG TPA: glycosyltransferase [Mycobacteriales bacterium]|nr:glycosyltransferase [Mycobacteriales bacterium]
MATDPVRVDVCMLTWNTRDLTVDALRRLRSTDQGVPYRLLLRDNASSDGTADAAAAAFPGIEVEAAADNVGFAAGMNALLRRTTAPYVFLLNGDAWPEEGALAALVAAAEAHPDVGVVAPLLRRPDGSIEHSAWPYPSLWLSSIFMFGLRRLVPRSVARRWLLPPEWGHDEARYVGWAVGAALLIPRRALDAVGGLDESFFMYGEDVEWCWRMRQAGFRVWFEPAATVRHVGGASGEQRYPGAIATRKAGASAVAMRKMRGPLVAALFRLFEACAAFRIFVLARLRRDPVARAWAAGSLRGYLGR